MKMKINSKGIELMHRFEGCRLEAYICPSGVPTIGWGNTYYEDGTKVKMGDKISQERADALFLNVVGKFERSVSGLVLVDLSENQFSTLVSFVYNVGVGAFKNSTLLKKVNADPNDPSIIDEFLRWNKGGGKVLAGLTRRREAEANLYKS